MFSLIILLLISYVRTQQDMCSCSCCIGQSCSPVTMGTFYVPSCTIDTCRAYCRTSYSQCQSDSPNGQVLAQCSSAALFNCRCDCCNTGSPACIPFFVGYSTAYSCQPNSCSIACYTQYPTQCISNQNGQTSGTCIGPITTTTTATTTAVSTISGSVLGNTCTCICCQSGPSCSPNTQVGTIIVLQCSPFTCIQACQNQYPSACPSLSYLGQTNGICTNQGTGNTRCQCQCCGINGCPSYDVYTNGGCTSCPTLCQQRCSYTNNVIDTCYSNGTTKSIQFSFPLIIFISIIILSLFFL